MVSIVIPVYDRADLFEITLQSILLQKSVKYEIIVIDDNSLDKEIEKVSKKYNVKYFRNETNLGAQQSRNIGVSKAHYEHIAFLDSDDIWDSTDKLLKQYKLLFDNQDISIVFTSLIYIDIKGIVINIENKVNKKTVYSNKDILKKDYIGTYSSVMVRKKDFISAGMCNIELPARQDWDLWVRLTLLGNAYKLSDCCTKYRIHDNQISSGYEKKINGFSMFLLNHKELYMKNNLKMNFYMHLFKLILLSIITKTTTEKYNILMQSNKMQIYIINILVKIILLLMELPIIKRLMKKKLSKTYLFKGVDL